MSELPPQICRAELQQAETLDRLDLACREWGVFYLSGHGLGDTDALFAQARDFFALPGSVKYQVRRSRENAWGYFDEELTKNTRDWKEIFDFGPRRGGFVPQWPSGQAAFRRAFEAHYANCEALAFELLQALSTNLGVAGGFLDHAFEPDHSSFVRLNYYPPCPQPAAPRGLSAPHQGHLGVNHHTDSGALTLLLTDNQPGLEVYVRGGWQPVPPRPGALIVNIGDVIQVWSNDRYKAPVHRVRCQPAGARMSIPFFFNPRDSFDYAPLTGAMETAAAPRYRPINFGEFRSLRVSGDFADSGEEVQISHYRVPGKEA